jgi:hypothetical protein
MCFLRAKLDGKIALVTNDIIKIELLNPIKSAMKPYRSGAPIVPISLVV